MNEQKERFYYTIFIIISFLNSLIIKYYMFYFLVPLLQTFDNCSESYENQQKDENSRSYHKPPIYNTTLDYQLNLQNDLSEKKKMSKKKKKKIRGGNNHLSSSNQSNIRRRRSSQKQQQNEEEKKKVPYPSKSISHYIDTITPKIKQNQIDPISGYQPKSVAPLFTRFGFDDNFF